MGSLVDDGARAAAQEVVPPKVEYSLTEQGKQFQPVLEEMRIWGKTILNND